jgi:chloramphenicol-sensitive protein RarD
VETVSRGTAYGGAAYLLWGLFPLYWPLLQPATAVEVLAHRIVWSLAVVVGLLAVLRRLRRLVPVLRDPRKAWRLALAAVVIAVNWGTYIYAVSSGQVVETSLGYFMNPIVTVLLGVLAAENGSPPWIALVLAFSFAVYALLKKTAHVGAVDGLGVETLVLLPVAVGYLGWLAAAGASTFGNEGLDHATLLALSGIITAIPLLLFAAAAASVPLSTLGVLQYLAPTLQFLIGVAVFDEPMSAVKLAGFVLVWIALVLFSTDLLRHHRRQLRLAVPEPA